MATKPQYQRRSVARPNRLFILFAILVAGITAPALVAYVALATTPYRYTDPVALPPVPVAIVFGAGVRPDGSPSPMLADRVQAAVDLYQHGQVHKLLMSGDNSTTDYDEVSAMKAYATARGVPANDIKLDHAGLSTYDTCYRARAIFGVSDAVLVTQRYHLPRAVYTCRQLGMDAVGLGTPDWETYSTELMRRYVFRESLATLNALREVHLTQPRPALLGPFEDIE